MDSKKVDVSLSVLVSLFQAIPDGHYRQLVSGIKHLFSRHDAQSVLRAVEVVKIIDSPEFHADCRAIQTTFTVDEKAELIREVAAVAFSEQSCGTPLVWFEQIAEMIGLPEAKLDEYLDSALKQAPRSISCCCDPPENEQRLAPPTQSAGMPDEYKALLPVIRNLTVKNLTARYPAKKDPDIQNISFSLNSGEIMAVMGPSGSGKSSIIRALLDMMHIENGQILVNGRECENGILPVKRHVGYASQEDILDASLTVYENLYFYQKLKSRSMHPDTDIDADIQNALTTCNMIHKKDKRVASRETKLSGGQRRRLNMAMELLNDPEVLILDEPTSGLSSRDSEQTISFLKDLTRRGKMVLIVIHQPSSTIYQMFDKVLVLNREGEQLFFGNPMGALDLFHEVTRHSQPGNAYVKCPVCRHVDPDLLLNAQEEVPADFWKALGCILSARPSGENLGPPERDKPLGSDNLISEPSATMRDTLRQLPYQVKRQLLSKSRDRLNQLFTFVIPPVLGILIAFVFRLAPDNQPYSIATNEQYPYFLFLIVITGLFLGLMSSVFEIFKDKPMLRRQSLSDVSIGGYFTAKILVLSLFAVVQSFAFILPAHLILGVDHMLFVNGGLMILITAIGIGFGLLFSTMTSSVLAAYNLVPLILIPQIILGGGFLPYTKMGEALYAVEKGCSVLIRDAETCPWPPNRYKAPFFARMLPASWAYEFLVTANYHFHPVRRLKDEKQRAYEVVYEKYDTMHAASRLTKEEKRRRGKDIEQILKTYNTEIENFRETLNEKVDFGNSGSELSMLNPGEFKAAKHGHFKRFEQNPVFDRIFSNTWFLDVSVLVMYLSVLYALVFFQVKRLTEKRRKK